jgi:hypothetical protein
MIATALRKGMSFHGTTRKEVGDNASMFPMLKSNYLDRGLMAVK